jgi:hypothetical protein
VTWITPVGSAPLVGRGGGVPAGWE